jgi:hypothetical protein
VRAIRRTRRPIARERSRAPLKGGAPGKGDRLRQAGDVSPVHFLYRYADDARDHVESIVRDRNEAEDIMHDVFAELVTAIG